MHEASRVEPYDIKVCRIPILSMHKTIKSKRWVSIDKINYYVILSIDNDIVRKLKEWNYVNHNLRNKQKAHVKPNIFDTINTEAKAYFLGLLWADGSLSKQPNDVLETIDYQYLKR